MARLFGGTDRAVGASVTPINFDFNNPFSVSLWIYPNDVSTNVDGTIVGHLDDGNSFRGWEFTKAGVSNGGNTKLFLINAYSGTCIVKQSSFNSYVVNTWYHAAVTYSGSHLASGVNLYVNGSIGNGPVEFDTLGINATTNSIVPYIGLRHNLTNPFPGRIADIGIWNVELTAGEISALAKGVRPFALRSSAIVAYWPLDGLSSPEPDLSGNANNGTLTGTSLTAGPPITLFTLKLPIFAPLAPSSQIFSFSQMSTHVTQKVINIAY